MSAPLVLSLFPGADLFGMAFEREAFCVVQGPELQFGRDVHGFHPPSGKFDGIIGGPPCQAFSRLVHIIRAKGQTPKPNLIPEFERIVLEAQPEWFVMENVEEAPEPKVDGYYQRSVVLNNRWLGEEQNRIRRFTFGSMWESALEHFTIAPSLSAADHPNYERAVVATSSKEGALAKSQQELARGKSPRMAEMERRRTLPGQQPRRTVARCAELQGLPADFLEGSPYTAAGKYTLIGNGVPIPMGRAIAKAVKRAMYPEENRPAPRCGHTEPGAGYECELPVGHAGDHRAILNESDEQGPIPQRQWCMRHTLSDLPHDAGTA